MLGGEGWLNFMGNEFGHPEWLDFPREGNGWSYHYCRRQWSLVDNPDLKYPYLGAFDRAMLETGKEHGLPGDEPAELLNLDPVNKVLCARRGDLVFVFNLSTDRSIPDYKFPVPGKGAYRLSSTPTRPSSAARTASTRPSSIRSPDDGTLSIYTPARTAMVFAPLVAARL